MMKMVLPGGWLIIVRKENRRLFPGDLPVKTIVQLSGIDQRRRAGLSFYLHGFLRDRVSRPAAFQGDRTVGRGNPLINVGVNPVHAGFAGILQGGSDGGQVATARGGAGGPEVSYSLR